jgi:hypothetical protein
MIFDATIAGKPTETITCRVFDPARRQWYTGSAWGTAGQALLTTLVSIGGGRLAGQVPYETPGVIVEYLNGTSVIGEDAIPATTQITVTTQDKADIAQAVAEQVNQTSDPLATMVIDAYPPGTAGAALSKLAIVQSGTNPVFVVPAPNNPNLQTLWGIAKKLGEGQEVWAEGDEVVATPASRNQAPGG